MTKQEYYNLLVQSALDGTFPSIDNEGCCHYRGTNSKKCAIGVIMPDELYLPRYDQDRYVVTALPINVVVKILPEGLQRVDLGEVQRAHDNIAVRHSIWDAKAFIDTINNLSCFHGVNRVQGHKKIES